ncbi:hypothetical protein [Halomonas gudaonensis]
MKTSAVLVGASQLGLAPGPSVRERCFVNQLIPGVPDLTTA